MRNRILLTAFVLGAWLLVKALDFVIPGPAILILLCLMMALMLTHSIRLFTAQSRWRRRLKHAEAHAYTGEVWTPAIDIFIAAKNESQVIENCVRNLFKLDYVNFHLWIIDDNSSDNTAEIVERLATEYPRLILLKRHKSAQPGKSAALNEALPLSKGEVIAVFDADAYVRPDFLRVVLPVLEPERVGAVQAQKRIYEKQTSEFLPNCQASEYAIDTYLQVGRDLVGGVAELRGNGQLIKRSALVDVGGWNNQAITDDLDLSTKLLVCNWNVRMCPQAAVWEEGVSSIKALIRQRRRWAEGSIRRYLEYIFPLNSPTRLSLMERIDTFAYSGMFIVPALIFMEAAGQAMRAFEGGIPDFRFSIFTSLLLLITSGSNILVGIRYYRPTLSWGRAIIHSGVVMVYVFVLWLPCIFLSFNRVFFKQKASIWHPTQHVGESLLID
jgi:1,2-diacylglycerol 3-beta-glucosyltransferase